MISVIGQAKGDCLFFVMSLEFRFQSASTEYQKIQTELASLVENRTRLDAQLSENEMVKKVCCRTSSQTRFTNSIF